MKEKKGKIIMKKLIGLIMTAVLVFALCGCDSPYDVDLTSLSSTMVYAEVLNMLQTPDEYIGKNVKMSGKFSVYTDEKTGKNYFACIIPDATACCSQGIEFVLADDRVYPDEYPKIGTFITVTGVFGTYYEDMMRYCQLTGAEITF